MNRRMQSGLAYLVTLSALCFLGCAEGEQLDPPGTSGASGQGGSSAGTTSSSTTSSGAGAGTADPTGTGDPPGTTGTTGTTGAGGDPSGTTGTSGTAGDPSTTSGAGGAGGAAGSGLQGTGGTLQSGGAGGVAGGDASVSAGDAASLKDVQSEPPPACLDCQLKVQYRSRDNSAATSSVSFVIKVVNTGAKAIGLSTITVRYWFTSDGAISQTANCDYAKVGCSSVAFNFAKVTPAKATADNYLEVSFTGTESLNPGADTDEIQIRVHESGYAVMYQQSNDYSFQSTAGTTFVDAPDIGAYAGGKLAWGTEP